MQQRVEPPCLGELPRNDGDDLVAGFTYCLYELGAEVLGGLLSFFVFLFVRRGRRPERSKEGGGIAAAIKNKSLLSSLFISLPRLTFVGSIAIPTRLRRPGASGSGAGAGRAAAGGAMRIRGKERARVVSAVFFLRHFLRRLQN